MWADEIGRKMRKIQRLQDEWEAANREEKNWIDIDEKEERPFILEGRRISMSDLQVILEMTVKMNMLSDDQVLSSWLNSLLKLMNGSNSVPMSKVIGKVWNSTRH